MSVAGPLQLTLKYHDEAVAAGKKLYNKIFDVTPTKSFVGKSNLVFQLENNLSKSLYQKYGNDFYSQPFKNPDLYKTQDDVLSAIALGQITKGYGSTILKDKFKLSLPKIEYRTKKPKQLSAIDQMLFDHVNKNPNIQQKYEDLMFHAGLLNPTISRSFKQVDAGSAAAKNIAVLNASFINRAIDKAMDKSYLSEYGPLPFYAKYYNALKDVVDPNSPIMSAYSKKSLQSYIDGGEKIAKARGLDLDFRPPVFQARRLENQMGTVDDGRTVLPMSIFNNVVKAKNAKEILNKEQLLSQYKIGEQITNTNASGFTDLRYAIPATMENADGVRLSFIQQKRNFLNSPGIKNKVDQINRLFPESKGQIISLDHIQPQRFGGTNDSFNLRYIFESGHLKGAQQTYKESDDFTFFVNPQGQIINKRLTVSSKTAMENEVYKKTKKIIDLVADGKIKQAEKLSEEVFVVVDNFKKVNPNIDFKLGIPFVPVKSGKDVITYVPYANYKKLNQKQMQQLFAGDTPLIQEYENLPNAGDTIAKSFDKAYEKLAPFIAEGQKLSDEARRGLFEMKRGGAVGLQDGGDPSFLEKLSNVFQRTGTAGAGASAQVYDAFKDAQGEGTPEQIIELSDGIRLQGFEDFIKEKKNKFNNQYDNENLTDNARQYISSKNNYAQFLEDKKIAISKAQVCGVDPNAPGCQAFFPDGKFVNGITNESFDLGPDTVYDVMAFYDQMENTDYFKDMFARAKGLGDFSESTSQAKKEVISNSIKRLPLATADLLLDFYQELSPPGIAAGQAKEAAMIRKGTDITRDEFADYIKQTNPDVSEEFLESILDDAMFNFDQGVGVVAGSTGKIEEKFGRQVFMPAGGIEGRDLTGLEVAKQYGISGLGFLPLVVNPTYTGKIMEVLSRKDIGTFGKVIRTTPLALGIPTTKDAIGILKLMKNVAVTGLKAPVKIPMAAGRFVTAEVKPGTENVFVVGSKTLPQLGLSLPASELAKRQSYQQMIKNTNILINQLQDEKVQEKVKADEKAYQEFKLTTVKPDFEYQDQLIHYYQDAIRNMVDDPNALPFPDTDDIEYLSNLPFDPEETPDNVIRYARELADAYIERNNLKRNTIGDMLFFDMMNKKTDEKKEDDVVDIVQDVPPGLAMGGEPGQFTDPLRTPDDSAVDIRDIQESPAYMGLDELDLFEDAKLKPTKESALPEVQVANVIFGKAPGWAIAGANKIDDLLRSGNTGTRIAQSDKIADAATSAGEKINRFYSNLEARLIDPNAPEVFNTPADLFNFLQSKGISKFEVEDYQIPQLLETVSKTGQPITKAALLDRIKNAPIRKMQTKVQGFRSEIENADGQFIKGKYGDSYYEGGAIPETYRENILYLDPADIPDDIKYYQYSTHGFFPDDETKYVIGWTRGTDRYAIIPGTKTQLPNIGPKTEELNKRIERLTTISNRSAEDLVNQSGGRITLDQAQKNIDRAGRDLAKAQEELANIGKTDDAVITGDQTVRVTFADEIQSDIMQTYRKKLEEVITDYNKLVEKGIDVKDTQKLRQESYRLGLSTDQDVLAFYSKHKDIMRPLFRTEEDFAAYIKELKESQAVFRDLAKVRPGMLTGEMRSGVAAAAKQRDRILDIFEQAYTDPKTMKKLFPNVPMKDRKVWGDALIKNDLHMAAKRKFIDKDPNASDWYVISPAELVTARYGQRGTTATPFAERTKDMKGIGQYEFYGGPNVTDPNGKHYTSVLEQSLRRAAKVNNADFRVVKVQISEGKSVTRSVQVVNAQGDVVKEFKMAKSAKQSDFADVMDKARDYITESGAEGLIARPVELPSGFKTVDAYAIKLTPEMVLSTKTHLASGGYVKYDPLVSMDEMIGAA
jgi:hypothetical protein